MSSKQSKSNEVRMGSTEQVEGLDLKKSHSHVPAQTPDRMRLMTQ